MNSHRMTARIVGVFFLIGYVALAPASVFLESILNAPDYLIIVSANKTQVLIGVLIELTNAAAVVGIAVLLFPILKKYFENIALWYVGFRVIEAAILVVSAISLLSLLTLSQEYVTAGAPDASYFQTLGTLFIAERFWAYQMVLIFVGLGGLMLYYILYQSKLLPRFISVWGLIGYALLIPGALLDMFGFNLGLILSLPGGANEIFLGIWLIVKGFDSSALASADS